MSSPWVAPNYTRQGLAVIAAADHLRAKIPGSLFYAYHGFGYVFLVTEPAALTFSHGYPTLEQAIGNSNNAGGPSVGGFGTGGGADLASLETAGNTSSGAGGGTGSDSYVAAWFNVTTVNDQQSQGQSPNGPNRRQITDAAVGSVLGATQVSGGTVATVLKKLSAADQQALSGALDNGKAANGSAVPLANASSGAGSVLNSFLGLLTSGKLWLRVAEGVLGIMLIAVGLARITNAVPVATSIAKKVGVVGLV